MGTEWHFPVMIAAALVEFVLLLFLVLGRAVFRRRVRAVSVVSLIVVVAGHAVRKYGLLLGLAWWLYYPVRALVTIVLPPLVFKTTRRRTVLYLVLAALSAPLIHVLFSFFLGWREYMPFLPVPGLAGLLGK